MKTNESTNKNHHLVLQDETQRYLFLLNKENFESEITK